LVNVPAVAAKKIKVVVDGINSSGSLFIPELLRAMGVEDIIVLNAEPNGHFAHNPEPLAEHLVETCKVIQAEGADMGIVVDPDVDRLAFIDENGVLFGEEYTLVACADYVLKHTPGTTVSNLSSTRALRDITEAAGQTYAAAAVGEVNVVVKMKEVNAVIGGEGNGGIIYPELHYGRDSLVGIALFLSHLAHEKKSLSELRDSYPKYTISKNKIELTPEIKVDEILVKMAQKYAHEEVNTTDGVKIYIGKEWVHLRKSNTEPIIRIYSESKSAESADALAERIIGEIKSLI
jgi:phosphomannomutase